MKKFSLLTLFLILFSSDNSYGMRLLRVATAARALTKARAAQRLVANNKKKIISGATKTVAVGTALGALTNQSGFNGISYHSDIREHRARTAKEHEELKAVSPIREKEIRDQLKELYNKGILKIHPSMIDIYEGHWSARIQSSFFDFSEDKKYDLWVSPTGKHGDRISLLHEVGHINNDHSLKQYIAELCLNCAWLPFMAGATTPTSFLFRLLIAYTVSKPPSYLAKMELRRHHEREADVFAANNSSVWSLSDEIDQLRCSEDYFTRVNQSEYDLGRFAARTLLALQDEHYEYPWNGKTADRYKNIYNKKVENLSMADIKEIGFNDLASIPNVAKLWINMKLQGKSEVKSPEVSKEPEAKNKDIDDQDKDLDKIDWKSDISILAG